MEAIAPIFFACVVPMILLAGAFLLGRWSASHTFRIERRSPQGQAGPGSNSPYYEEFEEERLYDR